MLGFPGIKAKCDLRLFLTTPVAPTITGMMSISFSSHVCRRSFFKSFFYICFIQNIIINNTLYHRLRSGCFCTYQIYYSSHSFIVCTHSFFAFTQQHVHISILSFTLTRFFFVYIRCYSFFHHHSSILSDFYTLHCR